MSCLHTLLQLQPALNHFTDSACKGLPCSAVDNVLLQKTLQLVLGARGPQVADPCYGRPIKLSLQNFEGHGMRIFSQNVTSVEFSRNWIWLLLSNPLRFKGYATLEILIPPPQKKHQH